MGHCQGFVTVGSEMSPGAKQEACNDRITANVDTRLTYKKRA